MKILLIGKNGQIGKSLLKTLKKKHKVDAFGRQECDLVDKSKIIKSLENIETDLIINAAAYTNVEKAENDKKKVLSINSEAVKTIALIAKEKKIPTINFSTDYVFDGKIKSKYLEENEVNPLNIYGISKMYGEEYAKLNDKNITIRTSRVYSSFGNNFISKIIALAKKEKELKIINDQIGTPTSSKLISEVLSSMIDKFNLHKEKEIYGTYHIVAEGSCSWYDYAKLILEEALKNGHSLKVGLDNIYEISSENFESNVNRPKNSVLCTDKIKSLLSIELPEWKEDVKKTIQLMIKKK
jgi:dTDP-4-dehydrorhamnose reductase